MTNQIQKFLNDFLEYLEGGKNLSQRTVRNYDFYLRRFLGFTKVTKPSQITLEKVKAFHQYLSQLTVKGKSLNQSTQNYHLIALRSFLRYLSQKKIKKILSFKEIKLGKINRQLNVLAKSDLGKILEAPLKFKELEIIRIRDKAILELLFSTGLKVSEVAELKVNELDLSNGTLRVKERVFVLNNQTKHWLGKYLNKRQDKSQALFISHDRAVISRKQRNKETKKQEDKKSRNLSSRSIQRLVEKYARASGVTQKVTPQTLRHAYAIQLIFSGADLKTIKERLGHHSVQATSLIYKSTR